MNRGRAPLLTVDRTPPSGTGPGTTDGLRVERSRGRVAEALRGFADSFALAAVALLGCLALVLLGAAGSLLWAVLTER
jgi:hypothetical protein